MAQRTPSRSILSVVPSKAESGELTTKKTRSRRSRQRPIEPQIEQRPQEQQQKQQQATDRNPSQRHELSLPQLAAADSARHSARLQPSHRAERTEVFNPRQQLFGQSDTEAKHRSKDEAKRKPKDEAKPSPRGKPLPSLQPIASPAIANQFSGMGRGSASPRNQDSAAHKTQDTSPRSTRRHLGFNKSQPSSDAKGQNSMSSQAYKQRHKAGDRKRRSAISPIVYAARLVILGVGIGVLAGTLLSIWDPARHYAAGAAGTKTSQTEQQEQAGNSPLKPTRPATVLQLSQEITSLKTQVQAMTAQNSELTPGVFILDVDTGAYLDLNSAASVGAASTIKVPILIAFFQDVDLGKIRLDEQLTMKPEHIAKGSGELQYQPPGTKYTALEIVTKMITISDNTATNILMERLGGMSSLNQRFASWGLTSTTIRNILPDLEGTNTTSPRDLVQLMSMVEQGNLVSIRSRDRLLAIMRQTVNNSLLPQGLGEGATIAHKTGDIRSVIADVGLIDMPNGKRYLASIMVKRPDNDARAEELIRQISGATYKSFNGEPVGRK